MTDARTITKQLGGRMYGQKGRAACPVCQHDKHANPALSIIDGRHGGAVVHCFRGCDFIVILDALKARGLIEGAAPRPASSWEIAKARAEDEAQAVKRAAQAQRCWSEAQPITGTPAETYLRTRGIAGDLPDILRFHPECWHATAKRFPALVARVDGGERFAVHRTYLTDDGTGKAPVEPNKAMLGSVRGGAVRLSEGDGRLLVGEGIETVLSVLSVLSEPVMALAALSTSGMKALVLPPRPGGLLIAPDADEAGRRAAHDLAERAHAQGWSVSMLPPPDGCGDWNDALKGAA